MAEPDFGERLMRLEDRVIRLEGVVESLILAHVSHAELHAPACSSTRCVPKSRIHVPLQRVAAPGASDKKPRPKSARPKSARRSARGKRPSSAGARPSGSEPAPVAQDEKEALAALNAELEAALPALEQAIQALSCLSKNDIVEMRSYISPPCLVRLVMEAVCVLLGEPVDWPAVRKMMHGPNDFLRRLLNFDKDKISAAKMRRLRAYVELREFCVEEARKVSMPAASLVRWVLAMKAYHDAAKPVAAARARLLSLRQPAAASSSRP